MNGAQIALPEGERQPDQIGGKILIINNLTNIPNSPINKIIIFTKIEK